MTTQVVGGERLQAQSRIMCAWPEFLLVELSEIPSATLVTHLAFPPAYRGSLGYEDSTIGTAIRSTCWLECGGVQDESTCQNNMCMA